MTDREMLEMAAKAAGIAVEWRESVRCLCYADSPYNTAWAPLTDDGDAFRLAVKLGFYLDIETPCGVTDVGPGRCVEQHGTDPYAATRRAITRAAAAIGASLP